MPNMFRYTSGDRFLCWRFEYKSQFFKFQNNATSCSIPINQIIHYPIDNICKSHYSRTEKIERLRLQRQWKNIFLLQMPLTLLGSWIVLIFQVKLTKLLFLLFGPSFFPAIRNRVREVPSVRFMALPTLLESLQCSPFPSHSPPESSYRRTFQRKFSDSSERFRWIVVQHISPVFEVHRGFCGGDDR